MTKPRSAQFSSGKSSPRLLAESVDEPIGLPSRPLRDAVHKAALAVGVFDAEMHCRISNKLLAKVNPEFPSPDSGKTILQIFGPQARSLEPFFRHVWTTGDSAPPRELIQKLDSGVALRRWLVNFYPVKDGQDRVRLVVGTFLDVTERDKEELRLHRLQGPSTHDAIPGPFLVGKAYASLTPRVLELVKRSMQLIARPLSLSHHSAAARMESELFRAALFLAVMENEKNTRRSVAAAAPPVRPHRHLEQGNAAETDEGKHEPSPRERQILNLLGDGLSNKQIAAVLHLSSRTVETYRARLMLKLSVHSTAELVRYAVRHHIHEA